MKPTEIFQKMSPALAVEIFTFLQTEQKPVYKAAIQGLANQRNLRAVFVERKPPAERHRVVANCAGSQHERDAGETCFASVVARRE